jgi:hypothetical protein
LILAGFLDILCQTCAGFFFVHRKFLCLILPGIVGVVRTLAISYFWLMGLARFPFFSWVSRAYFVIKIVILCMEVGRLMRIFAENRRHRKTWLIQWCAGDFWCPICMENVKHYVRLPCSHQCCSPCLEKWKSRSCTCPVCRTRLSPVMARGELDPLGPLSYMIL